MTVGVGIATLAVIFVFPGFRFYAPTPPVTPSASALTLGAEPPAQPVVVRVRAGSVELDGSVVDRTEGMDRVTRLDGLYDGLKTRRMGWRGSGEPPHTLILSIDDDVPMVVVKSVVQTCAFAGFDDVQFATAADR